MAVSQVSVASCIGGAQGFGWACLFRREERGREFFLETGRSGRDKDNPLWRHNP